MFETLEDYFRREGAQGKIDFVIRVTSTPGFQVEGYVRPYNESGDTTPTLIIEGNTIKVKDYTGRG